MILRSPASAVAVDGDDDREHNDGNNDNRAGNILNSVQTTKILRLYSS